VPKANRAAVGSARASLSPVDVVFRAFETPVASSSGRSGLWPPKRRGEQDWPVHGALAARPLLFAPESQISLPHPRVDRVQRSPNGRCEPASVDRQWMAALIPGAVFVLRVKMRLRPTAWQPVSGTTAPAMAIRRGEPNFQAGPLRRRQSRSQVPELKRDDGFPNTGIRLRQPDACAMIKRFGATRGRHDWSRWRALCRRVSMRRRTL